MKVTKITKISQSEVQVTIKLEDKRIAVVTWAWEEREGSEINLNGDRFFVEENDDPRYTSDLLVKIHKLARTTGEKYLIQQGVIDS